MMYLVGHCGLQKILPSNFVSTMILHYYQQRHVSWIPVFSMADTLRYIAVSFMVHGLFVTLGPFRGYFDWNTRNASSESIPDCWQQLVAEYRAEKLENVTFFPHW